MSIVSGKDVILTFGVSRDGDEGHDLWILDGRAPPIQQSAAALKLALIARWPRIVLEGGHASAGLPLWI